MQRTMQGLPVVGAPRIRTAADHKTGTGDDDGRSDSASDPKTESAAQGFGPQSSLLRPNI